MSKRKVRRYNQNRSGMIAISFIVCALVVVLSMKCVGLYQKNQAYIVKEQKLQTQLADEQDRTGRIEEYSKYVGTDEFIEETAREKLGLVYKGETIFKED